MTKTFFENKFVNISDLRLFTVFINSAFLTFNFDIDFAFLTFNFDINLI